MRILATISDMARLGIVLDVESGETTPIPIRPEFIEPTVAGRPPCRPFGITWNAHELFVANNRQLLIFDKQLEFLRTSAMRLQINVHQLAYSGERVWAVSPWTNSLIGVSPEADVTALEFDLACHELRIYVPRDAHEIDDKWHFNSLLWADGYLFVAAHTFGHMSFINRYDAASLQLNNVRDQVGSSIHGLARHNGELFWLSTKTGEIRSDTGYCHMLSRLGYARGFAVTGQYFIVATSEFLGRCGRHAGDSWIQLIDRKDGILLHEVHLPDTGSINDLRVLDEYDYGHCIDPFWSGS